MIALTDGTLIYTDHGREVVACAAINLTIRDNEFVGILGPSGSGKSSLLYLLSGLKQPTSGKVELDGKNVSQMSDSERSQVRLNTYGFVFQYPYLLGYLTALENVTVAHPRTDAAPRAAELLELLGVGTKSHRLPHELSGGERQRVCVARALMGGPRVIFADEPTASLDHTNGLKVVQALNRHRGTGSLVMVTHDATMLEEADRIIHIAEGRIVGESIAAQA